MSKFLTVHQGELAVATATPAIERRLALLAALCRQSADGVLGLSKILPRNTTKGCMIAPHARAVFFAIKVAEDRLGPMQLLCAATFDIFLGLGSSQLVIR